MSQTNIELRQKNPEQSEKMAQMEEPDNNVYGYLSREVANDLGEYISLSLDADEGVLAHSGGVTGSGSGNYVTFDTPGGAVVGLGVHLDVIEDVFGISIERDEDGIVQNAPDSIGLQFAASNEDNYAEAEAVDEEEVAALVVGSSDDGEDEEEVVEISDEELELVSDD